METYHPVEAKTNVQKLFWSKKEASCLWQKKANWQTPKMSYPPWEISEVTLIFRRGMRKPLATFFSLWGRSHRSLSNTSLTTKTSPRWETFNREKIAIAQVDETFGVEFSSAEEKVHFSDYKNLSNLEGHRYKQIKKKTYLKKYFCRDGQSKDEALGVTINSVILLVLLR